MKKIVILNLLLMGTSINACGGCFGSLLRCIGLGPLKQTRISVQGPEIHSDSNSESSSDSESDDELDSMPTPSNPEELAKYRKLYKESMKKDVERVCKKYSIRKHTEKDLHRNLMQLYMLSMFALSEVELREVFPMIMVVSSSSHEFKKD